jgi:hypothetical protein
MSDSGDRKPGGFDGDEATEVLPLPRAPNKTIEMRAPPTFHEPAPREDEDGPERKYLAPRVLAVQPVPDQRPEAEKIVINVRGPAAHVAAVAPIEPSPEAKGDADRARRRAPTVRIARGTLAAQGMLPGASTQEGSIDVSFDDESDAPGSAVSRSTARGRGGERKETGSGKLIALGVGLTVAVSGAVVAVLVFTGTLRFPGLGDASANVSRSSEPSPQNSTPASASATGAPSSSALPSASASEAPPTSAPAASVSAAPIVPPTARPRFVPSPRPYRPPNTSGGLL